MRYTVSAPDVPMHAAIRLPASKSISNRALILHALAHGRQTLCIATIPASWCVRCKAIPNI